jgi:MATE family multidrug resistance protein
LPEERRKMAASEMLPEAGDSGWHRRVLSLAVPIILANLSQPLLSLVDTSLAGHLPGAQFLGGVAVGTMFFNFVYWGFGFLRMATTGLIAQAEGARDQLALQAVLWRGLCLASILGLTLLALHRPLIHVALPAIGGSELVLRSALNYCTTRIWSAPAALANYVLIGTLLGRRQVHTALALQVAINLANAVMAIAAVYVLDLGVGGLGAATAAADWLGFLLGLRFVLGRLPAGRPTWWEIAQRTQLSRLAMINRDIFLRTLFLLLAFGWFTHASATIGDGTLAANALLLNFQTFMAYGLDGFAHVAEALVGVAIGRHDRDLFVKVARVTTQWAALVAVGFAITYCLIGQWIVIALTNQAEVRALALTFLPWAVVSPLISVWSFQLDGIFIGATRTVDLRNAAFFSTVAYLCLAALLQPRLGNHGLWLSFSLFMVLRCTSLAMRLPAILQSVSRPGLS